MVKEKTFWTSLAQASQTHAKFPVIMPNWQSNWDNVPAFFTQQPGEPDDVWEIPAQFLTELGFDLSAVFALGAKRFCSAYHDLCAYTGVPNDPSAKCYVFNFETNNWDAV